MRFRPSGLYLVLPLVVAVATFVTAHAQTDIALSVERAFSTSTTPGNSNFFRMNPASSAGGLFEFRHVSNPFLGWEVTYSFHRANEVYDELVEIPVSSCGNSACPPFTYAVSANAQELTADWVPSFTIASFRPFALLGAGLLLTHPVGGQSGTANATQPAFVYGAGLDWGLTPHIGLRVQYRGSFYKAPGIVPPNNTNPDIGFIHTAEPAIGVYYKF